jgi:hypothetical protein
MKDRSKKQAFPPNGVHEMAVSATYKYLRKCKLCMHYEVYQCPEQNLRIPPTYIDNGHYPPGGHGVPQHLRAKLRQHLANRARAGPAGAAAEDQNLADAAPPNLAAGDPNLADAAPPNLAAEATPPGLTSTVTEHFETFYTMSTALVQQNAVLIEQNKDMLKQNAVLIEQNNNVSTQNADVLTQNAILMTQNIASLAMLTKLLETRSEATPTPSEIDAVLVCATSESFEPSGLGS